jgi:hypothetical protein
MSKHSELPLVLLAALALSSCALGDVGDAAMDTRAAVGGGDSPVPEDEFPEVRTNCQLPGAALSRQSRAWRLSLPSEIYAARGSQPTAGRIACVTDWARERGLTLVIEQAR